MRIVIRLPVINSNPSDGNSPTTPTVLSPPPPPQEHQITPPAIEQGPNVENHPPSSPQENESLEEVMKKCQELIAPLFNFQNSFSTFDVIANWSNEVKVYLDQLMKIGEMSCPEIGPRLSKVADDIEEVVRIVEAANLKMMNFAKKIREILKNPAFKKLKQLQKERRQAIRREIEMEKASRKWSKKSIIKERVPMAKYFKPMPMKTRK